MAPFRIPTGALQVIDAEACEAMRGTFAEEARQPNFPGLLVDFDHSSHDPAQPTTAAGWISGLEPRSDGLYAQVRWSDLGHQALTGGRYRLASPVWNRADCDQWTALADGRDVVHLRPRRLDRLALTNDPNLPGLMPLSNRREDALPLQIGAARREAAQERVTAQNPNPINHINPIKNSASAARPDAATEPTMNLRNEIIRTLHLPGTAGVEEMVAALQAQTAELDTLRNRVTRLNESQAESDLERFADVITDRDVVRTPVARQPGRHARPAQRSARAGATRTAAPAASASAQPAPTQSARAGARFRLGPPCGESRTATPEHAQDWSPRRLPHGRRRSRGDRHRVINPQLNLYRILYEPIQHP